MVERNEDSVSRSIFHPHEKVRTDGVGSGPVNLHPADRVDEAERLVPPPIKKRGGRWVRPVARFLLPVLTVVAGGAVGASLLSREGKSTTRDNGALVNPPRVDSPTAVTEATVVAPPVTEAPLTDAQKEQRTVDNYLDAAGYPELKGHIPTFRHEVETDDAYIHVLSFLPDHILPPGSFNKDAYIENVKYIESIAREGKTFTWNPEREGGEVVSRQYVSRQKGERKQVNFVVLMSGTDPVPQRLMSEKLNSDILGTAIDKGTTFFWTSINNGGTSSFIRFADADTYKYALPTVPFNQIATTLQQLNDALSLEAFVMSGEITPSNRNAFESLKQSAVQSIVLAQEDLPFAPMADQRLGRPISNTSPRKYYPKEDGLMRELYSNAPRVPSVA